MKLKLVTHPNGFLQVGGEGNGQYNIFTSDCPRQVINTKIHNHAHGFSSQILYGAIRHRTFIFIKDNTHKEYMLHSVVPAERSETLLVPDKEQVGYFELIEDRIIRTGTVYSLKPGIFHLVEPLGFAVTWFVKEPRTDIRPYVGVRYGEQPDNHYRRLDFEFPV